MALKATVTATVRPVRSGTAFSCRTENHNVWFETHWGRSGLVITVHGAVDAANVGALGQSVDRCADDCEWLVIDLSDPTFTGTAAVLSALQTIADRWAAIGMDWALVLQRAAFRLLQPCESDWGPRIGKSLADALTMVQNRLYASTLERTYDRRSSGVTGDRT